MEISSFYLATSFDLPDEPEGGLRRGRLIAAALTELLDARCTSRWLHSYVHLLHGFGRTAALTDVVDVAQADVLVAVPQSPTSRGTHVEIGMALALDKPVFLYRVRGRDPTAFDHLCLEPTAPMRRVIAAALRKGDAER